MKATMGYKPQHNITLAEFIPSGERFRLVLSAYGPIPDLAGSLTIEYVEPGGFDGIGDAYTARESAAVLIPTSIPKSEFDKGPGEVSYATFKSICNHYNRAGGMLDSCESGGCKTAQLVYIGHF